MTSMLEDIMRPVTGEQVAEQSFASKVLALSDERYAILAEKKSSLIRDRDDFVKTINMTIKEVNDEMLQIDSIRVKIDPNRKAKPKKKVASPHSTISESRLAQLTELINTNFTEEQEFTTRDIKKFAPSIADSAISVAVNELRAQEVIRYAGENGEPKKNGNSMIWRRG